MSTPTRLIALALAGSLFLTPQLAAADGVGVGMFIGEPTGVSLKVDLQRNTALDIVLGYTTIDDGRDAYGHVTYLVTPFAAKGRSVVVPFRLGIGVAFYDGVGGFGDEVNLAVRAPLGLALQLRSAPVEFYGEVALELVVVDGNDNEDTVDLGGGLGFRIYF